VSSSSESDARPLAGLSIACFFITITFCQGYNRDVGTIFEASHIPLHIRLQAMFLIAGSKKGISSNQLHLTLGLTLKSAWFMSHRIREAMRKGLGTRGTAGSRASRVAA
jgi:hypothetical protein